MPDIVDTSYSSLVFRRFQPAATYVIAHAALSAATPLMLTALADASFACLAPFASSQAFARRVRLSISAERHDADFLRRRLIFATPPAWRTYLLL
jgi:hypothetical protein